MKKNNSVKMMMTISVIFIFVSCSKNASNKITQPAQQKTSMDAIISENGANPDEAGMATQSTSVSGLAATNSISESKESDGHHFVYTESNETGSNRILTYKIRGNGSLEFVGATASGGAGTGKGLGSQGALVLGDEHGLLFAVNAGSNSVSSFIVNDDGSLTLAHTENSGGSVPNSVTTKGNLLYVLNTGSDNIHGFLVREDGSLTDIDGSTQSLSGTGVVAPQISFTPNGDQLIVTEKATNKISSFKVRSNGSVWQDVVTASTGQTPFGFEFSRDRFMIVSNATGGAAGAGSATSYIINNGVPKEINGAIANYQAAPCWVAVTKYGRFAFVTNTTSNSISSYYVSPEGSLTLVNEAAASTDNGPVDIVVASNNYFVYDLNGKGQTIGEYHRATMGGLASIGSVSGLPLSATGLATF